ncbi:MAG TPA: hypothetical protein VN651_20105 [Gemmatimonadaceae bacterium]|nr:hypothetical protein [Gemmatimonadaceae bacterium]
MHGLIAHRTLFAVAVASTAAGLVASIGARPSARRPAQPETVMVTYRVKRGAEAELSRVLADHWAAARRLQLVDSAPHVIVKTADAGQPVDIIEIFTWRDASTPDNAPPDIQAAWAKMAPLVEARGGHPGIEPVEVAIVR